MAISKFGASTKWVELATSSPTSGVTVSFTSIPEYANYRVQYFDLTVNASSANYGIRFNNDTGSNYAQESDGGIYSNSATYINLGSSASSLQMDIQGVNELTKKINGFSGSNGVANFNALWNSQSTINRIDVVLVGTAVGFTGGTIKIYGKN